MKKVTIPLSELFGDCAVNLEGAKKVRALVLPDFATFSILTTEKYIENTAFGLYFFTSML